jgi:hypothetical protein
VISTWSVCSDVAIAAIEETNRLAEGVGMAMRVTCYSHMRDKAQGQGHSQISTATGDTRSSSLLQNLFLFF